MQRQRPIASTLADSVDLIEAAARLQRNFPNIAAMGEVPCWEPPVDMYGSREQLGVLIAMPGVASDCYDIVLENAAILVRGERLAGLNAVPGAILRLEIPYGKFERRIALPHGKYELISAQMENGCLRLLLERRK